MNLNELFLFLSADLVSTSAPEEIEITRAVPIAEAEAGSVTLLDDLKKLASLAECAASAVILPAKAAEKLEGDGMTKWNPRGTALLFSENPHAAFTKIVAFFNPPIARPKPGIHPRAVVDETAKIGPNVTIMANAVIGPNVEIGEGSFIAPGVSITADVSLGRHVCVFHNSSIGHDTRFGDYCHIYAQCSIGGNVTAGERVAIYPGSVVTPRRKLGDGAVVGALSAVFTDVPPGGRVLGNPAAPLD